MPATSTRADPLLLRRARLEPTGDPVDLMIRNGVIERIRPSAGASPVESRDLDGRVVLPGLWDCHVHSRQYAQRRHGIDLAGAPSAAAAVRSLDAAAIRVPAGVLFGYGASFPGWPELPHRDLLAHLDQPIVVQSNDLHSAWLNPSALARAGNAEHPTGFLLEQACFQAVDALSAANPDESDTWIIDAMRGAAARGVVGVIDFEMADNTTEWSRRAANHDVPVRVVCTVPRLALDDAIARGRHTGDMLAIGYGLLTVGPVKIFLDGSLGSRSASCWHAYSDHPDEEWFGQLEVEPRELDALLDRAHRSGLRVALHAIGDRANTLALDAFERAGSGGRIEHAQLVRPEDVPRFARLGVTAGVQPAQVLDDRDPTEAAWPGHAGNAFPLAGLLASGARLEFGSDAPVAPLDPWLAISGAMRRARPGDAGWHPEQRLTFSDALRCSTGGRTRVAEGGPADLVVLGDDGYDRHVADGHPERVVIDATMVGGKWTHGDDAL